MQHTLVAIFLFFASSFHFIYIHIHIDMPGGLERQNAFSEYYGSKTFVEVCVHLFQECCVQY